MSVNVTLAFAATLILLGVGIFIGAGATSPTALIPAAFGPLLLLTGALARNQRRYWQATVGTTVVALMGCLSATVWRWCINPSPGLDTPSTARHHLP